MNSFAPIASPQGRCRAVLRMTAAAFGLTLEAMLARRRVKRVVRARWCAMGLVRHELPEVAGLNRSLPAMGRLFGGLDHTTILNGLGFYGRWCGEMGLGLSPDEGLTARALSVAAYLGLDVPQGEIVPDIPAGPARDRRALVTVPAPVRLAGAGLSLFPASEDDMDAIFDRDTTFDRDGRGDVFGRFQLGAGALGRLPDSMQAEAAMMALERVASQHPREGEDGLARRASRMLGVSVGEVLGLARCAPAPFVMHELCGQSQGAVIEAPVPSRGLDPVPAVSAADRFAGFARTHLAVERRGEVEVPAAFATYRRYCRRAREEATSRANFGAALLAFARRHGGVRSGDTITAIALVEASAVPATEGIVAAPVPPAPASAERCTLAARPLRIEALPVESPGGIPAGAGPVSPDPLEIFLSARLVEVPGQVLSLERLREAVDAEGLSFHDVMARAKDRGQRVRSNAWGPDFLADAALVEARP